MEQTLFLSLKTRTGRIVVVVLSLLVLVLIGVVYYVRLYPGIPSFLSETKLKDRCPLEKTYRVCVVEGDSFRPQKEADRKIQRGELVLVKTRIDRYLEKHPENSINPSTRYQVCAYTHLSPSEGKRLSGAYLSQLAVSTFIFGKGYYVYCSKPTNLAGYEAKILGRAARIVDDKALLAGIWLFPGTNFYSREDFLTNFDKRISLYHISRQVEK